MTIVDIISIALIIILGVPHGSLDGVIARKLGWSKNLMEWISFNVLYLSIAVVVIIIWSSLPFISLTIFLLISGIHFGLSDISNLSKDNKLTLLPLIAHAGLIPIALPTLQKDQVSSIFAALSNDDHSALLILIIENIFPFYIIIVSTYLIYSFYSIKWLKHSLALTCFIFISNFLPALLTFSLYFCFWHSRGHMLRIWKSIDVSERTSYIIETLSYTIVTWSLLAIAFFALNDTFSTTLIKLVFIGLAALTVPHMILVDFWANKRRVI